MPLIPTNPQAVTDLLGMTPAPPTFSNHDDVVVIGTQSKKINVGIIAGLMQFNNCTDDECRSLNDPCCYRNPVFGVDDSSITYPTYENDFSSFLLAYYTLLSPSITITLQKLSGSTWGNVATLNSGALGLNYAYGSISGHSNYVGYALNWGLVFVNYGAGIYRIKIITINSGVTSCLASEEYKLLEFDCERAQGTVKFETTTNGKIGDKRIDYLLHDFTDMAWYDSLRVNGFFGYEKVSEYRTVNLEWGNPNHGKIQKVRDESVSSFEFLMRQDTPQYVHTRLMVYGMMADTLQVSDYNINNSDWDIKRMFVVRDSSYEPTYYNDRNRRIAGVKMTFKKGVQSSIKTNC